MKYLLAIFAVIEILIACIMLYICVFKHQHKNKFNDRFKLIVVLLSALGVKLGLYFDIELAVTSAGIFELIIIYILHTIYLQDFEPRRKYKDEA